MATTFSPRRIAAFTALWRSLTQARRPGAPGLGERLGALPRMIGYSFSGRYAGLGKGRLAMLAVAVAYLVSPVDLVPEAVLLLLGLTDDALVAMWLGGAILVETDRFLGWEQEKPMVLEPAAGLP